MEKRRPHYDLKAIQDQMNSIEHEEYFIVSFKER